jgi:hypothetical protein
VAPTSPIHGPLACWAVNVTVTLRPSAIFGSPGQQSLPSSPMSQDQPLPPPR